MSAIILRYTNANSITTPSANRSALFVDENGALAVKNSTGNITSFEVGPAGNTQVFFNANGNFEGSANFTFSSSTNVLTVLGNIAATRVLTDNLLHANGAVWDLELPAGANWQIQFNNNNSFGATGNLQMLGGTQLLVGATASNVDFPSARVIASQDNAGNSSTDNVGIAAEAVANSANSSVTGIGVLGHARANGATKGTGMQGQAFVTASADTGAAVGVRAYAIDTHSGGYNIGVLGNAMNSGVGNYAFYVQNGGIASIENNTFWDLNDNSNAALTFNSTGKANIFGIETTDNSEGIFTSGYLNVTGNISALGIKTNNYYYANGAPLDMQQPAGANRQVQYNNDSDFGASANFTFNSATNVLTVTGNISTGNISATAAVNAVTLGGSLTTASQPNVTSVGTLTSLSVTGNITSGNIDGGNLVKGNYVQGTLTTAAQPNITSVGTLSSATVTGNVTAGNVYANSGTVGASLLTGTLTTAAQPNVTSVGTLTSLTTTGNADANNLNATNKVVASTLTSNVSTGTAPLTVTSTTRVANLNVNYANVSDFGVVTAQSTGVYYPTFASGSSTGNYALAANSGISANLANGALIATTFAGNVSGNISGVLSNGTSNVSIPAVNGNVNIVSGGATSLVVTSTGVNVAGTLNATGNANVGNLGVAFVGATANVTAPVFVSNVAQGTAPLTVTSNTKVTNLNADLLDGYDTATAATANTVVVRNADGNITGNNITGTLTTASQTNITSIGTLGSLAVTANVTAGNVYANSGTIGASLLTGTLTTASQPNVTSVGTLTSLAVTGNTTSGNFVGTLANGNSTITMTSNGNIVLTAAGGTDEVTITSTGVNISGTLNATGNANVGNLGVAFVGASANVTAPTFVSNIATGTAPFTVSSTTKVANLNADTLDGYDTAIAAATANTVVVRNTDGNIVANNITGTLTTASQTNITSVGTLGSLAVTANITAGNVYANSGTIGASLLTGTLTTASQPNITSVGTLGSLTVTANVAAGNLTTTGVLSVTGTGVSSIAGNLDMTSNTIINLANPTSDQDAATKAYVDSVAQGLHVHDSCYVATTGNLNTATSGTVSYNNGSSGVGATLITTGTYLLIDGANVQTVGTRILVKNEANAAWNGIYTYTNTTTLTRATDFDTSAEAAGGDFVFVTSGSTQADTGWVQTTDNPTIGTSNIVWTQFAGAGTYTAGTGLTLTGTQFSITNTAVSAASYGNGDRVASFTVNAQGQLTAASNVVIAANAANLTGTTLATSIVTSSLTTVGTLGSLTVTGNTTVGNLIGPHANGNSNINIPAANGNVNISAVGNANILVVTGTGVNVAGTFNTGTGNANVGNLGVAFVGATANVTAPTFVSNIATGTAPFTVSSTTKVANLNADTIDGYDTATAATANTIVVRDTNGNITGNNITGTLVTASQTNITSVGTLSSLTIAANGNITMSGTGSQLSGANLVSASYLTGTLTTAAQPNITSVGTLTGLGVNGTVTAVNVTANTGVFTGNANGLTAIPGANVTGTVSSATTAGTVTTAAQPNITSVGTLTSLTIAANGNITMSGTGSQLSGANLVSATNLTGTLTTAAQPNITSVGTLTGLGVNGTVTAVNVTANTGVFTGNANGLTAIPGANVTGTVANATYATSAGSATTAGTVTTAAQPNITSVGTLTGLGVNGTITAVNITANTGVFTGNGNGLSSLQGANFTGTINSTVLGNSTLYVGTTAIALNRGSASQSLTGITSIDGYAATVSTAAQPNITSVGTLTGLGVNGNITGVNVIANTGYFISSVGTGISAAGTVQGNATALTKDFNVVSTVNSGTGVVLPTAVAGMRITVMNTGGNTLNVYPASNGIINSAAANVAFSLGAGGRLDFCAVSTTQWYTLSATYA